MHKLYYSSSYGYILGVLVFMGLILSSCIPNQIPEAAISPNLISTYHLIALANILQIDLGEHKTKTLEWVNSSAELNGKFSMKHSLYATDREDTLNNIYYVCLIMQELKTALPYPSATADVLRSLQLPDGSFGTFPGQNEQYFTAQGFSGDNLREFKLIATYRALFALHFLNATPANKLGLQQWLQDYWTASMSSLPTGKKMIDIADAWKVHAILQAMKWLNGELTQLPSYPAFLQQVKNWQVSLASLETLDYQTIDTAYTVQELTDLIHLPAPDFKTSLIPHLLTHQNLDGGFDLFLQHHSEPVGTFEAIYVIVRSGATLPNQEKLHDWIERRKSAYGGFTASLGCNAAPDNLPAYCDYAESSTIDASQPTSPAVK